jgi:hypothetical protein
MGQLATAEKPRRGGVGAGACDAGGVDRVSIRRDSHRDADHRVMRCTVGRIAHHLLGSLEVRPAGARAIVVRPKPLRQNESRVVAAAGEVVRRAAQSLEPQGAEPLLAGQLEPLDAVGELLAARSPPAVKGATCPRLASVRLGLVGAAD